MDRPHLSQTVFGMSVPREYGDGPMPVGLFACSDKCSPGVRGWTGKHRWKNSKLVRVPRASGDGPITRGGSRRKPRVFPGSAGMNRTWRSHLPIRPLCSPGVRGWTIAGCGVECFGVVFPVNRGMNWLYTPRRRTRFSAPCMYGMKHYSLLFRQRTHPAAPPIPHRTQTHCREPAARRWYLQY